MDDSQKSNESKLLPKFLGFVCPEVSCFCVVEGAQNVPKSDHKPPAFWVQGTRGRSKGQAEEQQRIREQCWSRETGAGDRPGQVCQPALCPCATQPCCWQRESLLRSQPPLLHRHVRVTLKQKSNLVLNRKANHTDSTSRKLEKAKNSTQARGAKSKVTTTKTEAH